MKHLFVRSMATLGFVLLGAGCGAKRSPAQEASVSLLASQADSVAYAFGLLNAEGFRQSLEASPRTKELSKKMILKAFAAHLSGEPTEMSIDEARQYYMAYLKAEDERLTEERRQRNEAALEEYKNRPGAQATESGLMYRILTPVEGPKPRAVDTVVVHYRGLTIDGVEFDSSYKRGEPTSFPLGRVIKGWTEGLALMSPGAKYELMIPSHLAYGERGAGEAIAPYSTLIFEIELLEIRPYQEPKAEIETKPEEKPQPKRRAKKKMR